eukprot:g2850.t1
MKDGLTFSDLLLTEPVLNGLKASGFLYPSPIQIKAIPLGRFGCDLIAQAKSGTGKTAVFVVVALETILESIEKRRPQVLVVAPTREIAIQIHDVARSIGRFIPNLGVHFFIGGMPVSNDRKHLSSGCHIAIGTPGRLCELIEKAILLLDDMRMLVLDEADKLNEKGFRKPLRWIISRMPLKKQVLAVSATFPEKLVELCAEYMRSPQIVRLCGVRKCVVTESIREALIENEERTVVEADEGIRRGGIGDVALGNITLYQCICDCEFHEKLSDVKRGANPVREIAVGNTFDIYSSFPSNQNDVRTLHENSFDSKVEKLILILSSISFNQCIVFCNDKVRDEILTEKLQSKGWPCVLISGIQQQQKRNVSIRALKSGIARILVTTDLTARGVDMRGVTLVINMDLPSDDATFMHRIGRTGRFGTKGVAITIISPWEVRFMKALAERLNLEMHFLPDKIEDLCSLESKRKEEKRGRCLLDQDECTTFLASQLDKELEIKYTDNRNNTIVYENHQTEAIIQPSAEHHANPTTDTQRASEEIPSSSLIVLKENTDAVKKAFEVKKIENLLPESGNSNAITGNEDTWEESQYEQWVKLYSKTATRKDLN